MAVTFTIPINVKIPLPKKWIADGFLIPILKPLWRGPKTTGTVLHDRMALRKSLFLCPSCVAKMGKSHLKRLGYVELEAFHGYGLCDGTDQAEQPCALWVPHDSPHAGRKAMTALRA